MAENELPAREAMEFDVVIVGAGPAGLAAAIRLKQLSPDISVVVVEKGSEVGAHILSGAVIDPIGLDRLLPDWRSDEDTPIKTTVTDDRFYWLSATALAAAAELHDAAADDEPRQLRRVARQCLPLARDQGGSARRRDLSGLRRGRGALRCRTARSPASPPATWASARTASRPTTSPAAWSCAPSTRCSPKARAARSPRRCSSASASTRDREPQKFGIGLKELWQVAPDKHRAGLVQHSFGWPLDNSTGGGSFLYHFDDNLVSVGFVVHLNYENPYLTPFEEFQRFKTHPLVRGTFEGGKRLAYGARAITEGGYQSVPKLAVPRRRADRLRGRLRQRAAHQGQPQRDAVRHAGGRACRGCARRRPQQRRDLRATTPRGAKWRSAPTSGRCATPSRCGRASAPSSASRSAASTCGATRSASRCSARLRHGKPDAQDAAAGVRVHADRLSEARRQAHLRPALVGVPLQHQSRGGPAAASQGRRPRAAEVIRARRLRRAVGALLPGGGLRMGGGGRRSALRDQRAELRPLQNLRYQGSRTRTSPGFRPKAAAGRTIRICDACGHDTATPPLSMGISALAAFGKRGCSCGADAKRSFSPELCGRAEVRRFRQMESTES